LTPTQVAQQQAQEQAEQRQIVLQMQEAQRRRWERLFLTTVEMSEPELRAALKHPSSERRFVATYVVGERLLEWQTDLLRLLGKLPDDEVAAKVGRSWNAVRLKREELGIPNFRDRRRRG
jgi:hypothetical protein